MWNALRVYSSKAWSYMPMSSDGRLLSEQGPLFPNRKTSNSPDASAVLGMTGPAAVDGGHIVFGHADGCLSYNGFLDVSLISDDGAKGKISQSELDNGDIVIAVFDNGPMPARVGKEGRKISLEFPDVIPEGKRCFVMDEAGNLISISYASVGLDHMRVVPRMALASWLYHIRPSILQSRFTAELGGSGIVIRNNASGKAYTAPLLGSSPEDELSMVSHALGMHGLGGIIPKYSLRVLKEPHNGQDNGKQNSILE